MFILSAEKRAILPFSAETEYFNAIVPSLQRAIVFHLGHPNVIVSFAKHGSEVCVNDGSVCPFFSSQTGILPLNLLLIL